MATSKSNIVLIGMPSAGKSTAGIILAKKMSFGFLDTDILIQLRENRSLQVILDTCGYLALREKEETAILDISCVNHVIATGGSAVYSENAMNHLGSNGIVIFLHAGYEKVLSRIQDFNTRGIAKAPGQSFLELFNERLAMYRKYADYTVETDDISQEKVAEEIIGLLSLNPPRHKVK